MLAITLRRCSITIYLVKLQLTYKNIRKILTNTLKVSVNVRTEIGLVPKPDWAQTLVAQTIKL